MKLIALDERDLNILSFYTADARLKIGNIIWQAEQQRFLAALSRFDWDEVLVRQEAAAKEGKEPKPQPVSAEETAALKAAAAAPAENLYEKAEAAAEGTALPQDIAAVLRFDRVLAVRSYGIDRRAPERLLSLKGLHFRKGQAPSGLIEFLFAEKAGLQLQVEYIEACLEDLPPPASSEAEK